MFFSCVIGVLSACLLPLYFEPPLAVSLVIKVALSLALVFVLCARQLKRFFVALGFFYAFTFLIGGATFGLLYLVGDVSFYGSSIAYNSKIPIGVIVGGIFLGAVLSFTLVRFLKNRRRIEGIECTAEITACGKTAKISGIIDTGNVLIDDDTGFPVAVIAENAVTSLFPKICGVYDMSSLKKLHFVSLNTVSSKNAKIVVFKPDRFLLYYADKVHIINDIMVGLCRSDVLCSDKKLLMPYL